MVSSFLDLLGSNSYDYTRRTQAQYEFVLNSQLSLDKQIQLAGGIMVTPPQCLFDRNTLQSVHIIY